MEETPPRTGLAGRTAKHSGGFTIIELLVGIAVAFVIFTSVFVLYDAVFRVVSETATTRPAAEALVSLRQDLQHAITGNSNACEMVVSDGELQFCTLRNGPLGEIEQQKLRYQFAEGKSLLEQVIWVDPEQSLTNDWLLGVEAFEANERDRGEKSTMKGVHIRIETTEGEIAEETIWLPGSQRISSSFERH